MIPMGAMKGFIKSTKYGRNVVTDDILHAISLLVNSQERVENQ